MHAWILGVALVAAATTAFAADDATAEALPCPRTNAAVIERFISAECAACWRAATSVRVDANQWLLDWIVPSARGDEAPLASAAPADARARARRALRYEVAVDRASMHRSAARSTPPLLLQVAAGPAWNGYFGVQVDGGGRPMARATVWIALVEYVDTGTDGSAVPRELVRSVAGPYTPSELRDGQPWQLLQAMRWPDTAKPARLQARAWIEDAGGRIVAMAGERCSAR